MAKQVNKQYRTQFRRSEFDAVQVPFEYKKQLAHADRVIQQMEQHRLREQDVRNDFLKFGIQQKNYNEFKSRQENFDFETEQQKAYNKAELARRKQGIAKAQAESKIAGAEVKSTLGDFSKTIIKNLEAADKKIGEDAKAYGKWLVHKYGLTAQQLAYIDKANQHVEASSTGINQLLDNLRAKGASEEHLKSIRNLSGRALLGAQEYALITAGQNYSQWVNENKNMQFPREGASPISLAQIEDGLVGDGALHKNIYERLYLEYLKELERDETTAGYNADFLYKHLSPGVEKEWERRSRERTQKYEKEISRQYNEEEQQITIAAIKKGGDGFINLVNERSYGDSFQRSHQLNRMGDQVAAAILTSEIKPHEAEKILTGVVRLSAYDKTLNPENDPIFEDKYPELATLWRSAIAKRANQEAQAQAVREKDFLQQKENERMYWENELGRPLNPDEMLELVGDIEEEGYDVPRDWATADSVEERRHEFAEKHLEDLERDGNLTWRELHSGKYNRKLVKDWRDKTVDGPNSEISKDFVSQQYIAMDKIARDWMGDLNTGSDHINADTERLKGDLRRLLHERVSLDRFHQTSDTVRGAYLKASIDLKNELHAGKLFTKITNDNGTNKVGEEGGIKEYRDRPTEDSISTKMWNQAKDDINGNILNMPTFYKDVDLVSTNMLQITGRPPGWAIRVARLYPKLDAWDIVNKARSTHKMPPITFGKPFEIDPRFARWANDRPSMASTEMVIRRMKVKASIGRELETAKRKAEADGGVVLSDTKPDIQPMRDLLRAPYAIKSDREGDGVDAILGGAYDADAANTGKQAFGTPISEMPIEALLTHMDQQEVLQAGMYGMTPATIRYAIKEGYITDQDVFDRNTQNTIVDHYIITESSQFLIEGTDGKEALYGLGRNFHNVLGGDNKLDKRELQAGLSALTQYYDRLEESGIQFPRRINISLRLKLAGLFKDKGDL